MINFLTALIPYNRRPHYDCCFVGIFSQAVLVDHTLYVSGQIGLDPATGNMVTGGVVAEAEQVFISVWRGRGVWLAV